MRMPTVLSAPWGWQWRRLSGLPGGSVPEAGAVVFEGDGKEAVMSMERTGDREHMGLEQTFGDLLRARRAVTLDDIAEVLGGDCFAQIFLTVDRWSRAGIVRLVRNVTGYRVELIN